MAYSLDYYRDQQKKLEKQIKDKKAKSTKLQKEITELKKLYKKLVPIKTRAIAMENYLKTNGISLDKSSLFTAKGFLQWRGHTKNEFDKYITTDAKDVFSTYVKNVDSAMDAINVAIGKRQTEITKGIPIIDGLNKSLTRVMTILKNALN